MDEKRKQRFREKREEKEGEEKRQEIQEQPVKMSFSQYYRTY